MIWAAVVLLIMLGLLLSAYFAGTEMGLYSLNRLRLELGVRQRDRNALRLARILEDEQGALAVTLVGTNVANYVLTTAVAYLFVELLRLSEADTELYTIAIVAPVVFVFCEVVPKNLFQQYADILFPPFAWILAWSVRIMKATGVVWLMKQLSESATRLFVRDASSALIAPKWRIAALLREALVGQSHGQDRSELIDRVFELSETPVHEVMVPRNHVTSIRADADRQELIRVARSTDHAYLPVLDSPGRHIRGIIYIDELLQTDDWGRVGDRATIATMVSPHDSVASAIARLQSVGRKLAVVIDNSGRMLGVVTMADLLEELVGDPGRER